MLDDRVSPVFDVSRCLVLWQVAAGQAHQRREVTLLCDGPRSRARELGRLGVDTLICGAVSRPLARLLAAWSVRVLPFVAGDVPAVLEAFCRGELPDPTLAMPGCGLQRRRCSRSRCR